eukprot:gnl/TRDRNA2_/TRDRNA2_205297_c0_seq1.p1 gnl/TRDRNA2_/TRDRNA2_205297_c0~~gnl/TRDRNA2_/TRDRNA2_205297_c0_seq1.p1  ORF type:complete len:477 (-),score=37.30 gnl/TRDRNA2_/TRDRNA2_205297_c0_seq1:90-1520(-)
MAHGFGYRDERRPSTSSSQTPIVTMDGSPNCTQGSRRPSSTGSTMTPGYATGRRASVSSTHSAPVTDSRSRGHSPGRRPSTASCPDEIRPSGRRPSGSGPGDLKLPEDPTRQFSPEPEVAFGNTSSAGSSARRPLDILGAPAGERCAVAGASLLWALFLLAALFWWVLGVRLLRVVLVVLCCCVWLCGGVTAWHRASTAWPAVVLGVWCVGMGFTTFGCEDTMRQLLNPPVVGETVMNLSRLREAGAYAVYFKNGFVDHSRQLTTTWEYRERCGSESGMCSVAGTAAIAPIFESSATADAGADAVCGWCLSVGAQKVTAEYCSQDSGLCGSLRETIHDDAIEEIPYYKAPIRQVEELFGWNGTSVDRLKDLPLVECLNPGAKVMEGEALMVIGLALLVLICPAFLAGLAEIREYCCFGDGASRKCSCCGILIWESYQSEARISPDCRDDESIDSAASYDPDGSRDPTIFSGGTPSR